VVLGEVLNRGNPSSRVWNFSRATGYRLVKEHMARASVMGGMACQKAIETLQNRRFSRTVDKGVLRVDLCEVI
jgi:hypothetical protein